MTIEDEARAAAEKRWPLSSYPSDMSLAERAGFIAGYLAASRREPSEATTGATLIAAERARQPAEEGYTAEHDKGHAPELAWAARCYAENVAMGLQGGPTIIPGAEWPESGQELDFHEFPWPWHRSYWKPTGDPVRDLTKAGGLIAAAIDSLLAERGMASPEPSDIDAHASDLATSPGRSNEASDSLQVPSDTDEREYPCPDYPAPCNCNDPEAHDGH